eukprot:s5829_g1.t1
MAIFNSKLLVLWRVVFFSQGGQLRLFALAILTFVLVAGATSLHVWQGSEPGDGWPQQAKILEKMMKVRLLRNLTEEELAKHHVDVVSLPPLSHLFWQQRETRLMARNLGYKTSLSDGKLTISVESSRDKFVRVSQCISHWAAERAAMAAIREPEPTGTGVPDRDSSSSGGAAVEATACDKGADDTENWQQEVNTLRKDLLGKIEKLKRGQTKDQRVT